MKEIFLKLLDFGVTNETDLNSTKKIRLSNIMPIMGMVTGSIVLLTIFFSGGESESVLITAVVIFSLWLPLLLNYYKRIIISRILYIILSFIYVVLFAIMFGIESHFQYYLIIFLGLPLILFGNEIGKAKFLLSSFGIICYFYLEWHFANADSGFFQTKINDINTIRIVNDVIIFAVVIFEFYFFTFESDRHLEELKIKTFALEERNKDLKHFAHIAAHDLNEPLRTVNSFIEIIEEEYRDPNDEKINIYFSFIQDSLVRMQRMIDSLLLYSKIGKSGDFQVTNINHLLDDLETDLQQQIQEKRATIKRGELPTIRCLQIEIRQLFQNLISNALKFQIPEISPLIEIICVEKLHFWEFCVVDNGIGIASDKKKNFFKVFTKLHLSSVFEGRGIGLAFCAQIIDTHQGKIWVESFPGEGSQFYFTIKKSL